MRTASEALDRFLASTKTDDHASSIDALDAPGKLQRDAAQQVDLHFRIGRILEEKLGERNSAVRHYERAIDIDPRTSGPGGPAQGLRRQRRLAGGVAPPGAGDPVQHRATRPHALERGTAGSDLPRASRRVHAVGGLLRGGAAPTTTPTRTQRFPGGRLRQGAAFRGGSAALLQLLVKQSAKRSADEISGFVLARSGGWQARRPLALGEGLRSGVHARPVALPPFQGLAEAHFALKDWEKASKFYQVLLMQHRDDLSPDEVVQAFHQLGVVKLEQGERRKALNMFDKALEQDPGHRHTLRRVIEIHARRQRVGIRSSTTRSSCWTVRPAPRASRSCRRLPTTGRTSSATAARAHRGDRRGGLHRAEEPRVAPQAAAALPGDQAVEGGHGDHPARGAISTRAPRPRPSTRTPSASSCATSSRTSKGRWRASTKPSIST